MEVKEHRLVKINTKIPEVTLYSRQQRSHTFSNARHNTVCCKNNLKKITTHALLRRHCPYVCLPASASRFTVRSALRTWKCLHYTFVPSISPRNSPLLFSVVCTFHQAQMSTLLLSQWLTQLATCRGNIPRLRCLSLVTLTTAVSTKPCLHSISMWMSQREGEIHWTYGNIRDAYICVHFSHGLVSQITMLSSCFRTTEWN